MWVESSKESLSQISENRLIRLAQKGKNQTAMAQSTLQETDKWFSAQRWLLTYSKLFVTYNLVSPMHSQLGRSFVRSDDSAADRGFGKKAKGNL